MKSIKIFAVAGAIGLLGMTGLSSCKQNNKPEAPSTYNGETVKTEFLINIAEEAAGSSDGTRYMPGETVQKNQNRASFRGMDNIILVPITGNESSVDTRTGKNITLASIDETEAATEGNLNAKNSVYYSTVSIPIGTKQFLFYSKAIDVTKDVAITTDAQMHQYGFVKANGLYGEGNKGATPSAISFDLNPIYTGGIPDKATKLATYLTTIANSSITGPVAWKDYTDNEGIQKMFNEFTRLKAGSSYSIQCVVTDLFNTLEQYQLGLDEIGQARDPMATAIMNNIASKADHCSEGTPGARVLALIDEVAGYPANINLPDGAAVVNWNGTQFDVVNSDASIGNITFGTLGRFTYPASLQYFCQSTIKTSTESQVDKYNGTNDWPTILGNYEGENGSAVQHNTKSVAINDKINYGVGQLVVKVGRINGVMHDSKGKDYNVSDAAGLKWKGVLVGSQKRVDYKFEQVTGDVPVYTIYDNHLATRVDAEHPLVDIPAVENQFTVLPENYTLVFSSENNSAMDKNLYIAIELVNNMGKPFFGHDGQMIPNGATFYLVGNLKVRYDTENLTTSYPATRNVFYKDYVTTAKLTIGANSLENAYYTIPDLRTSNLELGFSVDLAWTTGLTFDIEL